MSGGRWVAVALGAWTLGACSDPLPQPLYNEVTPPASYRTEAGGVRVDNEGYRLDAEGYRINKQGERIGMIDVPAKTAGDNSNAMAGYYISATGQNAPGSVAVPSEGSGSVTGSGPMNLPTPSQMPQQTPIAPAPANVPPPAGYR